MKLQLTILQLQMRTKSPWVRLQMKLIVLCLLRYTNFLRQQVYEREIKVTKYEMLEYKKDIYHI